MSLFVSRHPPHRRSRRRGFTLLEIAIVIGVIAILAGLGVATMRETMPRYRLVKGSKQLKSDLVELRMMAIEENRQTRLLLVSGDLDYLEPSSPSGGAWLLQIGNKSRNSNRWDTLPIDSGGVDGSQGDGDIDISAGGSRPLKGVSLMPWGTLSGPGTRNENAVVFSPRGWVENPSEDFQSDGYIALTLVNKAARASGINDFIEVQIARSGLVDLEASLGRDPDGEGESVGTSMSSTSGALWRGVP